MSKTMAESAANSSDNPQPGSSHEHFPENQITGSARDPTFKLPWQDKYNQIKIHKEQGNEKYKNKEYRQAIRKYHTALLYIRGIEETQRYGAGGMPFLPPGAAGDVTNSVPNEILQEVSTLKQNVYNNLAACILQLPNPSYQKVVQYCDCVLEESEDNVKALYRKGVALYHLQNPEDALYVLQKAYQTIPGQKDPNVKRYLLMCETAMKKQESKMKEAYKGMFQKMADTKLNDDEGNHD